MKTIFESVKNCIVHFKWWFIGGASLLGCLLALCIFWPQSKEGKLRSAIKNTYPGTVKIKALSYGPVSSEWPDSMNLEALVNKHTFFTNKIKHELQIGGAYADQFEDSTRVIRDSLVFARARVESSKIASNALTKCEYIADVKTANAHYQDTATIVFNSAFAPVWKKD